MWVINTTRQKMVVLHTIIRFFSIAGCFQIGLYEGMICIFGLPSALGPLTNLKQNRLSVSAPEYMSIKYRLRLKNSEWDPKQGQCHSLYALLLYAFNSWANTVNSIFYELGTRDSVAQISELRNVPQCFSISISHRVDNQQCRNASGRCWRQRYLGLWRRSSHWRIRVCPLSCL